MTNLEVRQLDEATYQCYRHARMLESMTRHLNPEKPNKKLVAKMVMTIVELLYYYRIIYHTINKWIKEMEPRVMYFSGHLRDYFPDQYPETRPERLLTA